jgi:hypothetical protein
VRSFRHRHQPSNRPRDRAALTAGGRYVESSAEAPFPLDPPCPGMRTSSTPSGRLHCARYAKDVARRLTESRDRTVCGLTRAPPTAGLSRAHFQSALVESGIAPHWLCQGT